MTECFELIDRKLLKGPVGHGRAVHDLRSTHGCRLLGREKAKLLSARRTQNHELQLAGHRMPDSHSCTRLLAHSEWCDATRRSLSSTSHRARLQRARRVDCTVVPG